MSNWRPVPRAWWVGKAKLPPMDWMPRGTYMYENYTQPQHLRIWPGPRCTRVSYGLRLGSNNHTFFSWKEIYGGFVSGRFPVEKEFLGMIWPFLFDGGIGYWLRKAFMMYTCLHLVAIRMKFISRRVICVVPMKRSAFWYVGGAQARYPIFSLEREFYGSALPTPDPPMLLGIQTY